MLKVYKLLRKQNTFEITLKYKGVGVRVAFVDGNTYNGTPARCYTRDAFKQKAIEASQMFKDHDIVLERTVEDASDRKAAAQKAARQAARAAARANQPARQVTMTPEPPKVTEPQMTPGTPANPGTPEPPEPPKVDDGLTPMTFDNLGEAIQYIAREWQMAVQTENEARKILKEHGIKPTIKKG